MKRTPSSDEGFVAVDAMVALTILATMVVLALGAGKTAIRLTLAAAEARQAKEELRYLLDVAPRTPGATNGQGSGFLWQVVNRPSGGSQRLQMCERTAIVRSTGSGRTYSLATAAACPP